MLAVGACAHRPEPFFFQYGAGVARLCAPKGTHVKLRQIAEELERCYFDERCEPALCQRIFEPAPQPPPPAAKPDASNWPSYDAPSLLRRAGPPRRARPRTA